MAAAPIGWCSMLCFMASATLALGEAAAEGAVACPAGCACPSPREIWCRGGAGTVGSVWTLPQLAEALGERATAIEILEATDGGVAGARALTNGSLSAMPRLRRLVLDDNRIAELEPGALESASALQELSLNGNLIEQLPGNMFVSARLLDRLFLSRNPLALPRNAPLLQSALRWLQIDACGLLTLPDGVFRGVNNLRVLQLRENALETLGRALVPLHRLLVLALQGNRLVRQAFVLPPNLQLLNVNDNDLSAIDKGMFDSARNLEYLFISNNYVSQVQFGSLLALKRLKLLDLGGNKLNTSFKSISTDASIELVHLEQLSNLKIDGNEIETLNMEIFGKLKKLKELSLSRNKIKSISNEIWRMYLEYDSYDDDKYSSVLDTLTLSENKIDFLGSSLRPFMSTLVHLNLSSNRLFSFSSSRLTQESQSSLKLLDLSYNRVNPSYARTLDLDYLPNLEYLSLLNNNIENLDGDTFRRLRRLKYLDLSFNKFKAVSQDLLRNLKELSDLRLNFLNAEEGIEHWPENLFASLSNLITLSMQGNKIRLITEPFFKSLTRLKQLDLSHNNLESINLDVFSSCGKLKQLNLKYNRLKFFSCIFTAPCSFMSVTDLDLEGNNFIHFERNLSTIFPSLESLDISKNKLEQLELDTITFFENLAILKASFNPIPCDCNVQKAWQLYGGPETATRVEATCEEAGEGGTSARPWAAAAALRCESATATALLAGVVLLGVLVAANALLGVALLLGWGSPTPAYSHPGRSRHRRSQGVHCWDPAACVRNRTQEEADEWDDHGNDKNARVERWRGQALYYGTDSEEDEADPARAGLPFEYNALRWAAARRANSRSTVNISHAVF